MENSTSDLTIYTTTWCGYCFRLKTAMKAEKITWTEINIEQDSAAFDLVKSKNNGNSTVPTVQFNDGSYLTNPSIDQIKSKILSFKSSC